ncbi:MAG TPA: HIT family protein [Acidimicrobiales bacterium]|nr:HIT family protein [Acidimicrobiales bacterium]
MVAHPADHAVRHRYGRRVASCTFCAIAAGELPGAVVLDEPDVMGFLDLRPVFPGHVLLVPRTHVETLPDLDPAQLPLLFGAAQRVAAAVLPALGADGTFVAMNNRVSQSVPHLHVHVVPRRFKDGLRGFFWPRQKYGSDQAMQEIAASIRGHIL